MRARLRDVRTLRIAIAAVVALTACSATPGGSSSRVSPPTTRKHSGAARTVERPKGLLNLAEAERYMLELINRDREAEGIAAVEWDAIAAKAGKRHAEDMAKNGFTAHIGTDGSVPEQRYTESGGVHMSQENAGCFADAKPRDLDPDPRFEPAMIEKVEAAFMAEKPPHDGHRKNILREWHTHVGVGLVKTKGLNIVCMSQEFTDQYGSYADAPGEGKVGQRLKVSGTVLKPAKFVGVGLSRIDQPTPKQPSALLRSGSYPIPAPFVTYFPQGFVTPIPVQVKGNDFTIEIPLSDNKAAPAKGRPGLYGLSVWAEVPWTKDFIMVSLRTIRVR